MGYFLDKLAEQLCEMKLAADNDYYKDYRRAANKMRDYGKSVSHRIEPKPFESKKTPEPKDLKKSLTQQLRDRAASAKNSIKGGASGLKDKASGLKDLAAKHVTKKRLAVGGGIAGALAGGAAAAGYLNKRRKANQAAAEFDAE